MAERHYPAIDVAWPEGPTDVDRELLLAAIDDHAPTAVEETPFGARVFFASADARDRAASALAASLRVTCSRVEVSDEQWAERSQSSLAPITVGRLTITTSRVNPEVQPGSRAAALITIIIRPSMGFGTGHHASTRLCLWLLQQMPLDGRRVLDIGTGSGVLAIAAHRLGAASIDAIDNDADAIHSALENLELNQAGEAIVLRQCDLSDLTGPPVDLVTANLTGAHLISSAAIISHLVVPRGRLILGGLQTDEEADVRRAFEGHQCTPGARAEEDGWVGLLLERT